VDEPRTIVKSDAVVFTVRKITEIGFSRVREKMSLVRALAIGRNIDQIPFAARSKIRSKRQLIETNDLDLLLDRLFQKEQDPRAFLSCLPSLRKRTWSELSCRNDDFIRHMDLLVSILRSEGMETIFRRMKILRFLHLSRCQVVVINENISGTFLRPSLQDSSAQGSTLSKSFP